MPLQVIRSDLKVDFVRQRMWAFAVTLLLFVVTIVSLATKGLEYGIDFKGGIVIEARDTRGPVDTSALRDQLSGLGLGDVEIQQFGSPDTALIRVQRQDGGDDVQNQAAASVRTSLGESYEIRRVEVVGPRVGQELLHAGLMATLLAVLAISAYVAFRFEWQFGVSALIATFHDVFVTLGLFSILGLDFNLTAVAALLTLAGYSLNDTVVVFDRIRETLQRQKTGGLKQVINDAINQTLSRTLMTAGTTFLALIPLLLFGGPTLLNFAVALTFGVLLGTFSSIYVAAAILLYMKPLRQMQTNKLAKAQAA